MVKENNRGEDIMKNVKKCFYLEFKNCRPYRKIKKYTVTSVFGISGMISWVLTIFLREMSWNGMEKMQFILGIMPNISACWLFIWFGETVVNKRNHVYTFKDASMLSGVLFFLAVISEIVHDTFLNSPFDRNDIIASIVAIMFYLISLLLFTRLSKQ